MFFYRFEEGNYDLFERFDCFDFVFKLIESKVYVMIDGVINNGLLQTCSMLHQREVFHVRNENNVEVRNHWFTTLNSMKIEEPERYPAKPGDQISLVVGRMDEANFNSFVFKILVK